MTDPYFMIITGEIETGKTNLCLKVADLADQAGIKTMGLVSPAVFESGSKIAIDIQDLSTGEKRRLARLRDLEETDLGTKRWSFFSDAVRWGNQVLREVTPCDLLIIDELGPLEFDRSQGWVEAFDLLDRGEFQAVILVIRPVLVQQASRRWQISRIVDLSSSDFDQHSIQDLLDRIAPGD